jgi:hypothetical protein
MLHTGNSRDVGENIAVVGRHCLRVFRSGFRHRQKEREDMVFLDAKIDVGQIPEAVDGKAGAGKQGKSKRKLADNENSPHEMFAGARACSPAFLERLRGIDARCIPGGSGAGQKPSHCGSNEREQQDGNVEAQICLAGQCIARHGGNQAPQHGVTHADSQGTAGKSKYQAFGK